MNPICKNEQKNKVYWKRICDIYHENKKFISKHTLSSLVHCWFTIQLVVIKFCSHYVQIEIKLVSSMKKRYYLFKIHIFKFI
jgi:CRISPR/Cas system endoribonuclease Cas6 (RAMP superfamily)